MKVPEATISALRRSRSSRDPSHQYTSSGWVSSALFSTQATRSAGASAGALSVIRWVVIWSSDFLGCEGQQQRRPADGVLLTPVSYTHLRAHETVLDLVCRLLL